MKNNSLWKRVIAIVAVLVMCMGTVNTQAATISYKAGTSYSDYSGRLFKVYLNGKRVNSLTRPGIMVNDNVMIPYKKTLISSKKINMTSSYKNKKLTLQYNGIKVVLYIGKKYMLVNGQRTSLNTAPMFAKLYGTRLILIPAKGVLIHGFGLDYTYDRDKKAIYIEEPKDYSGETGSLNLQASAFKNMSTSQFIRAIGPVARENYRQTGILASVTMAQAILESGWGKTTLAQTGNNIFGMKISLSGNTWAGSSWDGRSYVTILTTEEYGGRKVKISARFRKYPSVAQSIADHSAYLLNAKNGSANRYAGLASTTSYSKQIDIIRRGGYCTWSSYKSQLVGIINRYNLTQYDVK